jgi:predicted cupin superfamily sugar epimerase
MKLKEMIEALGLKPLPHEGGYYRETYRAELKSICPEFGAGVEKEYSTAIYYLITKESFSALHKVKQDEVFHFYAGSPVEMLQLADDGSYQVITIGNDILNGQQPQVLAPKNVWQGTVLKEGEWALMGATVSPAFAFQDFYIESRAQLIEKFPQLSDLITRYTHSNA